MPTEPHPNYTHSLGFDPEAEAIMAANFADDLMIVNLRD